MRYTFVYRLAVLQHQSVAASVDNAVKQGIEEGLLHFQIGPATAQTVASLFIRHFGQYLFGGGTEFRVGYQFFKYGRKLFRVVWTDFVEFFRRTHKL